MWQCQRPTSRLVHALCPPAALRLSARHASFYQMYYVEWWVNRYKRKLAAKWGPNAACAEWLFRCGAPMVGFEGHPPVTSRAELKALVQQQQQTSDRPPLKLIAVDASDSVIHSKGADAHMPGVTGVRQVRLNFCDYLDDTFFTKNLILWRNSLEDLEIVSSCISEHGVRQLAHFSRLRRLHLYLCLLIEPHQRPAIASDLRRRLPRCSVSFPAASTIGLNRPDEFRRAQGRILPENTH